MPHLISYDWFVSSVMRKATHLRLVANSDVQLPKQSFLLGRSLHLICGIFISEIKTKQSALLMRKLPLISATLGFVTKTQLLNCDFKKIYAKNRLTSVNPKNLERMQARSGCQFFLT